MPSTIIKSFTYDKLQQKLRIVLVNGKAYDYLRVPEQVFIDMKNSFAKGSFYNTQVKPFFDFEKVNDSEIS